MNGLELVYPKQSWTTQTDIEVADCFSDQYDNYLAVVRGTVSSGRPNVSLLPSQSDSTAYTFQELLANDGSVTGSRVPTVAFWNGGPEAPSLPGGAHYYFYGPWLDQPTAFRCVTASTVSSASIRDYAGTLNNDKSYTGFRLARTTGNMTLTIAVYGFTKGTP